MGVEEAAALLKSLHAQWHTPLRDDRMATPSCKTGGWLGNEAWGPRLCGCDGEPAQRVSLRPRVRE